MWRFIDKRILHFECSSLRIRFGVSITHSSQLKPSWNIYKVEFYRTTVGVVKLGSITRYIDNTGELFNISEINVHPNYQHNDEGGFNDVALIKLDREVKFNPNQRPICLNTKYLGSYDNVIATGWGTTERTYFSQSNV